MTINSSSQAPVTIDLVASKLLLDIMDDDDDKQQDIDLLTLDILLKLEYCDVCWQGDIVHFLESQILQMMLRDDETKQLRSQSVKESEETGLNQKKGRGGRFDKRESIMGWMIQR
ncbi:hypothetical protein QVD17_20925 [Tagetes erecta]|uniref:Uncharacterized protein n=1 Tax=Tagetes erecta TaxID=13708 RepID=A0AAD8KQR4_TARER|nr:hypothetical protein QVD17_20925 [Tagetes erecta]